MRTLGRKTTTAVLAATAVFGSLATAGTAHADSVPAVQVEVCNDASVQQKFWVKGYNQYNDWDDSPVWTVNAHTCATGWGYWWKKNASVELHYKRGNAGWNWKPGYLPRTDAATTTLRLS
ncbi:hypothetical protein [Streptomyces muensis]|uniref:Secreted protein n=1 Tax=Streptomyces muensis TaxID=1077944 RepID=A0A9X1TL52_STRM4|nr:hypothetical protein [Streptomyces muensis]MCF1595182.1 hypothetical protein [Streptomyces muensis]